MGSYVWVLPNSTIWHTYFALFTCTFSAVYVVVRLLNTIICQSSFQATFLSFTHGVLEAQNGTTFCVIYYPNITSYPSEKEEGVGFFFYTPKSLFSTVKILPVIFSCVRFMSLYSIYPQSGMDATILTQMLLSSLGTL